MTLWERVKASAARSQRRLAGRNIDPAPGVICPYLRDPRSGDRFRCMVHRNPQAQADNDWVCRKLCLPRGGPFKQTAKALAGGGASVNLRDLRIPVGERGRTRVVNVRAPAAARRVDNPPPEYRRRRFGRKVA